MTDIEYEILTKEIYQSLVDNQGLTIDVKHNIKLQGKAIKHQVDVYWEYEIAGIKNKVAIECKNYSSPVSVGRVRDFYGVLLDLGNTNGIIVTKVGFQKGAKEYASQYGINLMELREPITIHYKLNTAYSIIKNRIPIPDLDWIQANPSINLDSNKEYSVFGMSDDLSIFDSNGNVIKTFFDLDNSIPKDGKEDCELSHFFDFKDGYLRIDSLGMIKIKSIKYEYELKLHNREILIEGKMFAKAILENVLENKILVFDKDGKLKK